MIVIFSSILLLRLYSTGGYKIQNTVLRPSLKRVDKDFTNEIQTTKTFVENFINSYLNLIQKEVNPTFRDSFVLVKSKHLSARAIFSTVNETFLHIYPSMENEFIVDCTKYPVQMSLFSGLDIENSGATLTMPYEEALNNYKKQEGAVNFKEAGMIVNMGLNIPYYNPKVFSFDINSLAIIVDVGVGMRNADNQVIRNILLEPVCILTGERDFSFAINKASKLGRWLAITEILQLFKDSELFRAALADKRLAGMAEKIQSNISRAEKDSSYEYPLWQSKKDMADLENEAKKYGLDANYPRDLLTYPANKPKDGVLLWYYKDYFGFSLQWSVINIILILLTVFFALLKYKLKVVAFINTMWVKSIILIIINGWVFRERPKYMDFKYWIIPGILFSLCFILAFFSEKRYKNSEIDKTNLNKF